MNTWIKTLTAVFTLSLTGLPVTGCASQEEEAAVERTETRAMAIQAEAIVREIDLETRQVTLESPTGEIFTLKATEEVVKLEDVSVGDGLVVTYLAALEGELREPTEEELAEPWVEIAGETISRDPAMPGIAEAHSIRAVVTIEGMNRELGTVTVKDSRGKLHIIGGVEPEKMSSTQLGQTVVLVFTEALALTLDKKEAE